MITKEEFDSLFIDDDDTSQEWIVIKKIYDQIDLLIEKVDRHIRTGVHYYIFPNCTNHEDGGSFVPSLRTRSFIDIIIVWADTQFQISFPTKLLFCDIDKIDRTELIKELVCDKQFLNWILL